MSLEAIDNHFGTLFSDAVPSVEEVAAMALPPEDKRKLSAVPKAEREATLRTWSLRNAILAARDFIGGAGDMIREAKTIRKQIRRDRRKAFDATK